MHHPTTAIALYKPLHHHLPPQFNAADPKLSHGCSALAFRPQNPTPTCASEHNVPCHCYPVYTPNHYLLPLVPTLSISTLEIKPQWLSFGLLAANSPFPFAQANTKPHFCFYHMHRPTTTSHHFPSLFPLAHPKPSPGSSDFTFLAPVSLYNTRICASGVLTGGWGILQDTSLRFNTYSIFNNYLVIIFLSG